jgi:tRNA 5-methylaminomethyl-2-thiouridine biosynthesis bifunctional protein
MKTGPIRPAEVSFRDGVPFSPEFGDVYHPAAGALQQAQQVFLRGSGLPERWRGRERFVVLETGFGLGNNFLATWQAWRADRGACRQLHFISIERHPFDRAGLAAAPRDASLAPLTQQLVQAWPPLTPNLHRLVFDGGRVQLLLALGDVADWLPEIVARVDAFFLDGFAPARNPAMWDARLFKAMGRLAADGATVATWSAARAVREGLRSAGFEVHLSAGQGGKRDITLGRYAPAFMPRSAPARSIAASGSERRAVIIGAGLAGCATAWALAQHGWRSTLLDRHDAPAQEASGNPAGLFHGIVNAQDGTHARFNRAAALEAQRVIGQAIATGHVCGEVAGLLRLETSGARADAMQQTLQSLGLPADYVRAVDATEASALAGLPLAHPAWFYPGGGWVAPSQLARHFLDLAGDACTFRGDTTVTSLQRAGDRWRLRDAAGATLDEADCVVLANGGDALRLRGDASWPMESVRGQISIAEARHLPAMPRIPVTGAGYLLPAIDGDVCFGATAQSGDLHAGCRREDHVQNLAQLSALLGGPVDLSPDALAGRVGWRWTMPDRLPLVGGVPDRAAASGGRLDQPRFIPRLPGLFVFTGLGSRGITWCALGAQVLAATVTGAPVPLEAGLLDAVDPARFLSREARRARAEA